MLKFYTFRGVDQLTGKQSAEEVAVDLLVTRKITLRLSFRWKSAEDGITPWYQLHAFLAGTFLGLNPYTTRPFWWYNTPHINLSGRSCCSNGISLFSLSYDPQGGK